MGPENDGRTSSARKRTEREVENDGLSRGSVIFFRPTIWFVDVVLHQSVVANSRPAVEATEACNYVYSSTIIKQSLQVI